jgi:predicted TPR repeat methyltransferase
MSLLSRGFELLESGDSALALEIFEAATRLCPGQDVSWFQVGLLRDSLAVSTGDLQGKVGEVVDAYERAIDATDSDQIASACFNNIFEMYLRSGFTEEAARVADLFLQKLPEDSRAWFNSGTIMKLTGQLQWAETCFRNAATHGGAQALEERARAFNNLGNLYSELGRWDEAIQAYEAATELHPADDASAFNAALLYRDHLGDLKSAKKCLEKCLLANPLHNQANFQLAALLGREGDFDPASKSSIGDKSTGCLVQKAPGGYVSELFDHYAGQGYEQHMLSNLGYRAHSLVCDALFRIALNAETPINHHDASTSILDLGCGTGLIGKELRKQGLVGNIFGCDLSSKMVEESQSHSYELCGDMGKNVTCKVYSLVLQADCEDFINQLIGSSQTKGGYKGVDAVLAGDVLCYYGVLDEIMQKAADILVPGGLFIFTVEELESKSAAAIPSVTSAFSEQENVSSGYVLTSSARFAHSKSYVERVIGLVEGKMGTILKCDHEILRYEGSEAVNGLVFTVQFSVVR